MSNYYLKAKDKETGKIEKVEALDDYFGKHHYGYRIGAEMFDQFDFDEQYEVVEDTPLPDTN